MRVAELAHQTGRQFDDVYLRFVAIDHRFDMVDERFEKLERLMLALHDESMHEMRSMRQEMAMQSSRINRHERWIEELARHTRYSLTS